jgi:hypothetical protein
LATIILSYRREDTELMVGRICDRLRDHFGRDSVMMDIDSIPYGLDFRKHSLARRAPSLSVSPGSSSTRAISTFSTRIRRSSCFTSIHAQPADFSAPGRNS